MVKHLAESPPVLATEIARKCLHERITNRIGMAKAFTLDNLDEVSTTSYYRDDWGNQIKKLP